MEVHWYTIFVHQFHTDLAQVHRSWKDHVIGQDGVSFVINNAITVSFDDDFRKALQIIIVHFVFHRVEIVNREEEIHVRLEIDNRFACHAEACGGVYAVEVFAESKVKPKPKVIQAVLIPHHHKGQAECDGAMSRSDRAGRGT